MPLNTTSLHRRVHQQGLSWFTAERHPKCRHLTYKFKLYRFNCHCWQWGEGDGNVVAGLELERDVVIVGNHTAMTARAIQAPGTMAALWSVGRCMVLCWLIEVRSCTKTTDSAVCTRAEITFISRFAHFSCCFLIASTSAPVRKVPEGCVRVRVTMV